MANDVHAGAACADTFSSQTIASHGCDAAHNVSDVDSGVGRYRPADPQAMPVVQNGLNCLYSLTGRTTKKVMSGQIHAGIINDIYAQTGYWPALLGGTFNNENKWDDFE